MQRIVTLSDHQDSSDLFGDLDMKTVRQTKDQPKINIALPPTTRQAGSRYNPRLFSREMQFDLEVADEHFHQSQILNNTLDQDFSMHFSQDPEPHVRQMLSLPRIKSENILESKPEVNNSHILE